MRLGLHKTTLKEGSKVFNIYGKNEVAERHRHRYEFNPKFHDKFQGHGFVFSGVSEDNLVDVIEIKEHPWFIGCQYHPEFASTPRECHPLFKSYIKAAMDCKKSRNLNELVN